MLSDLQKRTAQAVVNVFETGRPQGDYGHVTVLRNDAGHLTFGRAQTTLTSGNLYLLIKSYCESAGAEFAAELAPFLGRLASRDTGLDQDLEFRSLLRETGMDPVMHSVQDQFFDRVFWNPSVLNATSSGITLPLGTNVVYDSAVHGSWKKLQEFTDARHGPASNIGEKAWIGHYVEERRAWLESHPNPLLHVTVYRMDAFLRLIGLENWNLALPLSVCGVRIDEDILMAAVSSRISAQDEVERQLRLETPFMVGNDVESVQRALAKADVGVNIDGIYGYLTEAAVRRFQQLRGLNVDGIVGPATRAALKL